MKKKILINLLLLIVVYIVLELIAMFFLTGKYFHLVMRDYHQLFVTEQLIKKKDECIYRRIIPAKDKKDGSIVIFGCSFAYGLFLNDKENLSGQLSKLTGRECINRAISGMGTQLMYYQLETGKIKKIAPNTKYFIYVYIPDHLNRVVKFRCWPFVPSVSMKYKFKNKDLQLIVPNLWTTHSYIYRLIEDNLPRFLYLNYRISLFYNLVKKSYEITKKEFPNSEFIIIDYPLSRPEIFYKDEFEAMGIKVYNANELAGVNLIQEKYQLSKDDCHPNAKAWELIAPALVKKEKM